MSHRKKVERALAGNRIRHEEPVPPLMLKCVKCGTVVAEAFVAVHLNACQQGKAECGKCKKYIAAHDFVNHFKSCRGLPAHEGVATMSERESESDKPPG